MNGFTSRGELRNLIWWLIVWVVWMTGGLGAAAGRTAPQREDKQQHQTIMKSNKWSRRNKRESAVWLGGSQLNEMKLMERKSIKQAAHQPFFERAVSESNPTPTTLSPAEARRVVELVALVACFFSSAAINLLIAVGYELRSSSAAALHSGSIPFFLHFGCFAHSFFIKKRRPALRQLREGKIDWM